MDGRFGGKVVVVTGAGTGLGLATALRLAQEGADLSLVDLDGDALHKAGEAVGAAAPDTRVSLITADVSVEDEVASYVEKTIAELGRIDGLYNNAGIEGKALPIEQQDPTVFQRVLNINIGGVFYGMQAVLPHFYAQGSGVIVNTASAAAFDGQIGQAAYSASKGGVVGMTLPIARDLASSLIRVMTIAPGLFDTPMLQGLPEPARQSLAAQVPMPSRLGDPSEYAALVRHICENPMLNGEVIRLDGAIRMAPR